MDTRVRLSSCLVLVAIVAASGCAQSTQSDSSPSAPGRGVSCQYPVSGDPAKPVDPPSSSDVTNSGTVEFTLKMTAGDVRITMDRSKAPCAINSFESLVKQRYYDNTSCHRLVDQGIFILQCGDPTKTGKGGPGYSFADELTGKETYPQGTVAMANAGPNTNGSQFFLVWEDSSLPAKYTVLGQMDDASTKVIAQIAAEGVDGTNNTSPIAEAKITSVVAQ